TSSRAGPRHCGQCADVRFKSPAITETQNDDKTTVAQTAPRMTRFNIRSKLHGLATHSREFVAAHPDCANPEGIESFSPGLVCSATYPGIRDGLTLSTLSGLHQ